MNSQNEGIAVILANRCYLYTLLQCIFGDEPSLKLLESVTSKHTREALDLLSNEDTHEFDAYLGLLINLEQAISTDAEAELDRLKSEYTYLMLGPGKLPAPPWESVYVTKERLIFQESTLKVRRTYLDYQFLPANYPHEADDHIALELDFMAHLARLSQECFVDGNVETLQKVLSDQKAFLEEHLLVWIGDFAEQMQTSKTRRFYPHMASLTERILRIDYAILDEFICNGEQKREVLTI